MIVKLNRCKHCGKEYKYYASGVCSEYNNDTYCNDCYKAMMDSLRKIPRKYAPRYNVLPDRLKNVITYDKLKELKKEFIDEHLDTKFPITLKCFPKCYSCENENSHPTEYCEEYIYDGMDIIVCFNDLEDDNKIIKVKSEYDVYSETFTGKVWSVCDKTNKYIPLSTSPILTELKNLDIKPNLGKSMILSHEDACTYLTEVLKDLYYKKEP